MWKFIKGLNSALGIYQTWVVVPSMVGVQCQRVGCEYFADGVWGSLRAPVALCSECAIELILFTDSASAGVSGRSLQEFAKA